MLTKCQDCPKCSRNITIMVPVLMGQTENIRPQIIKFQTVTVKKNEAI